MPATLDALRDALPTGSHIRLSIWSAGQPTVLQDWTFTECTEESTTIRSKVLTEAGELLVDEGSSRSPWTELHQHAAFPAASTTRIESSVDVPIGHYDTWLYTVQAVGDDGVPIIKRFHFARTLPGPPVLYTMERQGVEVFRMTMVERS